METPVIISACRTPIGKFGKSLVGVSAPQLGALVIEEAMKRAKVSAEEVDEVIMGNVVSAGLGQNPTRQAAMHAGVPFNVGSVTINKVCGSGLKAVMLAAQSIKAGDNVSCGRGGHGEHEQRALSGQGSEVGDQMEMPACSTPWWLMGFGMHTTITTWA